MGYKRVLLIVSPVSRPQWVDRYIPSVKDIFEYNGIKTDLEVTQKPGDPSRLATQAKGEYDAVVMAGGDGSINEVMNALCGSNTPVGILPFGTVNVFARELGLPLNPIKAAQLFVNSEVKPYDMGKIGDRHFLLMASYGLDVLALNRNPRLLKKLFGRYSYVMTSLCLLPFYQDAPIRFYLDDSDNPIESSFVIFMNGRFYAGSYEAAPKADMHDGMMDVVYATGKGRMGFVNAFMSIRKGKVKPPLLMTRKAKRVRIAAPDQRMFQVDGDPTLMKEERIVMKRDAILVARPCP